MKKRVEAWLRYARLDLDAAYKLLENSNLTQISAFHCQQAVEKSLKALLEEASNKVPRTHDLERLYGLIEDFKIILEVDEDLLDQINDVYIEARYPSDMGLLPDGVPSDETVTMFYEFSKNLYDQVVKKLDLK